MAPDNPPWHLVELGIPGLAARGLTGRGITIGVIDTGVVRDHPQLAGCDVRAFDVRGPDFDGNDFHGHGTSMTGLIVGRQGAIAPGATVISIKALLDGPQGDLGRLIQGIELALDHGVDILSLSVGSPEVSSKLSAIIQRAVENGVVVVAAGEDASGREPLYPAALTPVISVTAGNRLQGCLFGRLPDWLDLVVPGVELQTLDLKGIGLSTGTSPATAVCAGVCALLLELSPAERRRALASHVLGFVSSTGKPLAGSHGPNAPVSLVPAAAADAIVAWLKSGGNVHEIISSHSPQ